MQATTYNLPNYVGELFAISPLETPFLSAIGGLSGGRQTMSTTFAAQSYELPAPTQPSNREGQDAPEATHVERNQDTNVVQIFHEAIDISYSKQAAIALLDGAPILGEQPVTDELAFQTARKLEKIARDIEWTFINGVYDDGLSTGIRKTRGLLEAIQSNAIDAAGAELDKALMDQLLLEMFTNGANFSNSVIMVNGNQAQRLSAIYGTAPADRTVGGLALRQIYTEFGVLSIMVNRWVPSDTLIVADLAVCAPVFLLIPDKGHLFREELARTGASIRYQLYGEIGLAYGHEAMHGKIIHLDP